MSDDLLVVKPGVVLQDRYEIQERVARGGFAIVWRAHDRLLGKDVALKVLHEAIADDEAAVEELKQETLRSRELTHENIVQVYDFLRDGDVVAIAMEYIEGETLSALAAQRPDKCFEPADLTGWLVGICDALDYAHAERGKKKTVVHHDIKPGNFMVDRYGTAKVLDFGISKTITETQIHHTGQFVIAGTPPYMSPQQLKGQRPCPSDDIYSFGATLYALLTGKPPFFRGDIQLQIPHEVPPSMTERRTELGVERPPLPTDWEELVASCLDKDPDRRPASMSDIAVALGVREPSSRRSVTLPHAEPAGIGRTKVLGGGSAGLRPPRRGLWIAGGAVAVAAAVAALLLIPRSPSPGPVSAAETPVPAAVPSSPAPVPSTPPVDPGAADRDRAAEARRIEDADAAERERSRDEERLRVETQAALADGRWSVALDRARSLLALVPDDPSARSWRDRATRELGAQNRLRSLRSDVESALSADRWDDAAIALEALREAAPADAEIPRWESRIQDHFARAERIDKLTVDIPRAIGAGSWKRAADLLDQLEVHAPNHPDATTWHAVVDAQLAVRDAIEAYRSSQEALDAEAYRRLWLSLSDADLEKIRRSYADMRSQQVQVEGITATIDGDTAEVRFRETHHFDLRAGGGHDVETDTRLTMRRAAGGDWKIASRTMER